MKTLRPSFRSTVLAGGAVLILGGSAVGIAAAQSAPTTPTTQQQGSYQKFISALAQNLNIQPAQLESAISKARGDAGLPAGTEFPGHHRGPHQGPGMELQTAATFLGVQPDQLRTQLQTRSLSQIATDAGKNPTDLANALKTAANTHIDQAVTAGRLTADQASQMKTQVAQRIDQMMTQVNPHAGFGGGPRGFGGPGMGLQTAATFLGVQPDQLRTQLQTRSLSQIATDAGKNPTDLANALKTAADTRIDQAVTNGKLTADQASQMKSRIGQRIDQMMTQVMPQHGPHPGAEAEGFDA